MNPLRIAFLVTRSDTIGGSHIHVRDLGKMLIKEGHQVNILMGGIGPIVDHFQDSGLKVTQIPHLKRNISPLEDLLAYREIKKCLEIYAPELISTHSSKAGFLGRLAANSLNIPVLFTAHGWSFTSGKKALSRMLFRALERWVAPMTDRFITVSEYDRQLSLKELSLRGDDVVKIHNGMVDIAPNELAEAGSGCPVNLVMVARFDHQKNHRDLLRAVSDIPNLRIHFVGDGPLMKDTSDLAEELGMSEQVIFHGRLESVTEVLSKSNIFALISNWEGFPRSTLEAMRAALPTIVSDVGGAAEAVVHRRTGFVVPKGDIASIKKAVRQLVENPEKRAQMGREARRRYEKNYTFDIMYDRTLSIYREILNQKF